MKLKIAFNALLIVASMAVAGVASAATAPSARSAGLADAQDLVDKAAKAIDRMTSDSGTAALLRNANGLLMVPEYLQAGVIVGGQAGAGVLLVRHAGRWSDPAFFTISGLSVGLQAGGDAGPVAYVLMTPRAVQKLENRLSKFSLGADAGLTVAKFSDQKDIGTTLPTPDIIVWTGTKGFFGGVAFDATDVVANTRLDQAFYPGAASVRQILNNTAHNRRADPLRRELTTRVPRQ